MHTERNSKTLGPQAALLVTGLHERGKIVFRHSDVEAITSLKPKSARNFMASLVRRGLATRLKPGLFVLVPFELGRESEYLGNPYVVARELACDGDYYISHASAMDIHGMVTQPQLVVYTTALRAIRPRTILGTEFRFVRAKSRQVFGTNEEWVTKTERVRVSDPERTVIDGLKQSEYCGGFSEVAKGFWIRKDDMDPERLVDYAMRLDVGAVIRRLGFLLELFEAKAPGALKELQARLTPSYALLDPLMPDEGEFLARWRLRINIEPEEIRSIVRT